MFIVSSVGNWDTLWIGVSIDLIETFSEFLTRALVVLVDPMVIISLNSRAYMAAFSDFNGAYMSETSSILGSPYGHPPKWLTFSLKDYLETGSYFCVKNLG